MKRKHRNINVDGVEYGWTVGEDRYDYMEKWFSIYKDGKFVKSIISKESAITPKMVAEAIKQL